MSIKAIVAGVVLNARNTMKSPALISSSLAIVIASNACAIDSLRLTYDSCGYRWIEWNSGVSEDHFIVMRSCSSCPGTWQVLSTTKGHTARDDAEPSSQYRLISVAPDGTELGCLTITGDSTTANGLRLEANQTASTFSCGTIARFAVTPSDGFAHSFTWYQDGVVIQTTSNPWLDLPIQGSSSGTSISISVDGCTEKAASWPPIRLDSMPSSGEANWVHFRDNSEFYQFPPYESYATSKDECNAVDLLPDSTSFRLSSSSVRIWNPLYATWSGSGGSGGRSIAVRIGGSTSVIVRVSKSGDPTQTMCSIRHDGALIWIANLVAGSQDATLVVNGGLLSIDGYTQLYGDNAYADISVSVAFDRHYFDCNRNSIDDTSDIASATSPDRDANGVPDECQTVHVPGDYATIQAAIDAAPATAMRIVDVAAGTFAGPIDFKGKPVVVHGAGAGQTVLSGSSGQSLSVVRFSGGEPATAALEAVTVRGGLTGTPFPTSPSALVGGGVFAYQSAASIRDCIIEQNSAGFGGGLYEWGSTGKVERCTLRNNNSGADSGGAQVLGGAVSMTDCLVQGNHSEGRGAGLHLVRGTPTLARVQVIGNTSNSLMGGISWYAAGGTGSYLTIRDCTVTGNNATVNYGGIGITDTSLTVSTMSIQGTRACTNIPRPNIGGGSWTDLGGNTICDCVGDLTLEGLVNGADLGILLASWGVCTGACASDLNHDGVVNGADLGVLLNAWGTCGD